MKTVTEIVYGTYIEYFDKQEKRRGGEYRGRNQNGKIFIKPYKGNVIAVDESQLVKKEGK